MLDRARSVGRVMAVIVAGIGAEVWFWLAGFGRLVRRYRIATVGSSAWLVISAWQAWWTLFMIVAVPVVLSAGWRRGWPYSFARRVSDPMWRRRVRRWVRRRWPMVADSCDLSRRVTGRDGTPDTAVPGLGRLRWWTGRVLVADLGLLPGQTVDHIETAADPLRVTVGADRIKIIPNRSVTGCSVAWTFGDPLEQPIPITVPDVDAPVGRLDVVCLGVTEDGDEWWLPIRVPTLGVGCAGSGKSTLMEGQLIGLGPAIAAGLVEVCGIDLKGGVELAFAKPMLTRYATTSAQAVVLLEELVAAMEARLGRQAGVVRDHTPTTAEPLVIVLVDELAALIAYLTDRDLVRRAEAALSRLLSAGRAAGYVVHGFVQDPRKETVKMRHLFRQAVGLRLREREEVTMALSDGALAAGAWCHKIPPTMQGVGYVLSETDGRPVRVRGFLVTDDHIRLAAERFPAPRQEPIIVPEQEAAAAGGPSTRTRATSRRAGGSVRAGGEVPS